MHAFLICASDKKLIEEKINQLLNQTANKPLEYNLLTIDKVRELERLIKLKLPPKTTIIIRDIDKATLPALNAFLKNLEEPQENLNFILTADSLYKVLPTITSRCQVIKLKRKKVNQKKVIFARDFFHLSLGKRFLYISNLRKREEAVAFLQDFIQGLNAYLLQRQTNKLKLAKSLFYADKTLEAIRKNGHVQLQLTNFILNF